MKRLLTIGQFLMWFGVSTPASASGFEGVITVKETSEGTVTTQQFFFKGEKMRLDAADAGFSVWDAKHKEGFFADPEDKTYVRLAWSELQLQDTKKVFESMTVTKTGKSENVAGYSCEMYLSKDKSDDSTSEFCIAKGLSNAALYGLIGGDGFGRGGYPAWFRELVKDGGFPLRTIDRDKSGKEESRSEATKVEAKRLDDQLFIPPAGFKQVDRHR